MQDPLLSAMPPDQRGGPAMPNPISTPTGLAYPRWPFLAAVFINACGAVGYLLWRFAPCPAGAMHILSFVCNSYAWPQWLQFLVIWLLFLLCWLVMFIFGYGSIENSPKRNVGFREVLRLLSEFEAIRWLLMIYGALVLTGIIAMLWLNQFQIVPFTLASIVVFVAIWTQVRRTRQPLPEPGTQEQLQQNIAASTSPLYVFRSLPLIRGIWPPRP